MRGYGYNLILSATSLIGDSVRNPDGEDLGKLHELMMDINAGNIAYAVVSFGGFLGMGDKLFAIPWKALSVNTKDHTIMLNVDKKDLENAPGFDKDDWPDMANREWIDQIHSYYDVPVA